MNEQGNLRVQIADSLNISVDLIKLEQVPARRRRLLQSGGSQIIITITVPPPIPGTNTSTTGNSSNAPPSAALISSQIQNSVSLSVVQSWFTAIGLPANLVSAIAVEVVVERIVNTTTPPMLLANTTTPVPSLPASTPIPIKSTEEQSIWTVEVIVLVVVLGAVISLIIIIWLASKYQLIDLNTVSRSMFSQRSEYVPIKTRDPMESVRLQMRYKNHV